MSLLKLFGIGVSKKDLSEEQHKKDVKRAVSQQEHQAKNNKEVLKAYSENVFSNLEKIVRKEPTGEIVVNSSFSELDELRESQLGRVVKYFNLLFTKYKVLELQLKKKQSEIVLPIEFKQKLKEMEDRDLLSSESYTAETLFSDCNLDIEKIYHSLEQIERSTDEKNAYLQNLLINLKILLKSNDVKQHPELLHFLSRTEESLSNFLNKGDLYFDSIRMSKEGLTMLRRRQEKLEEIDNVKGFIIQHIEKIH